jgi:hypothetical protein
MSFAFLTYELADASFPDTTNAEGFMPLLIKLFMLVFKFFKSHFLKYNYE